MRVFDGEKVMSPTSVVVADGKIAAVASNVQIPPDAQVIDGTGDTLLPGLIDSHVHIWTRDVLASGLAFGVTTELDMFMRWREAKAWKQEEAKGANDIADFRTAGTCITSPGGHGTEEGGCWGVMEQKTHLGAQKDPSCISNCAYSPPQFRWPARPAAPWPP